MNKLSLSPHKFPTLIELEEISRHQNEAKEALIKILPFPNEPWMKETTQATIMLRKKCGENSKDMEWLDEMIEELN